MWWFLEKYDKFQGILILSWETLLAVESFLFMKSILKKDIQIINLNHDTNFNHPKIKRNYSFKQNQTIVKILVDQTQCDIFPTCFRYAAILFKKQRFISNQHRVNIKFVCKDNFRYEVQERVATSAVSLQQLAEEYWRIDKFFLISFPILFFIFNIIYWLAFILWRLKGNLLRKSPRTRHDICRQLPTACRRVLEDRQVFYHIPPNSSVLYFQYHLLVGLHPMMIERKSSATKSKNVSRHLPSDCNSLSKSTGG